MLVEGRIKGLLSWEPALEVRVVLSEAFSASEEGLTSLCFRRATDGAE